MHHLILLLLRSMRLKLLPLMPKVRHALCIILSCFYQDSWDLKFSHFYEKTRWYGTLCIVRLNYCNDLILLKNLKKISHFRIWTSMTSLNSKWHDNFWIHGSSHPTIHHFSIIPKNTWKMISLTTFNISHLFVATPLPIEFLS